MEILRRSDETRANQDGLVDNSAASVFMRLGISAFSDEVSSAACPSADSLQSDSKSWLSNRSWALSAISAFLFNEKYLWAFLFRGIAPRLKVLQNAARTQRRAVLDVHPHLVRVFQFPAQMARVICTAWIHESLS